MDWIDALKFIIFLNHVHVPQIKSRRSRRRHEGSVEDEGKRENKPAGY
jgi:hypothetical protein